ncbi:MAG: ATP-binding protein [Candidatus Midichloria sp.]|nr:ATP-binding protein [Candidatus Midichloria sp.]
MFNLTIKRKVVLLMGLIVTIIPIILIATLLYSYYLFGVEHFFNTKVNEAIEETVKVAQLYLQEHKDKVKIDSLSIANNIEKNKHIIFNNKDLLQLFVDQLANARGLAEIMVFQDGFVIIRNSLGLALWFENIKSEVLYKLENEEVIILDDNVENRVRAVTKIEGLPENTYVLVGRYIDQAILDHLKKTESSAKQYKLILGGLDITKHKLQIIFVCSSILLLTISVLIARRLALYITKPLEEMALATVSLRDGNFSVRVPEGEQKDEIHTLARAFNVMTEKISEQHNELVIANEVSNTRRKFIEVILAEVSVGILATNLDYKVISYNNIALDLLAVNIGPILKIEDIFPELLKLLENTKNSASENQIDDLIIIRKNKKLHLAVKSGPVLDQKGKVESLVITFSNITDLIYNQKIAAWADVARRIAHEIKNPLTPISLAAERLKRKYSAEIQSEPNSFIRYIDTIISHVGDIESMVAEFVDFAKIPDPKIEKNNFIKIIEESLLLQKVANPEITYSFEPKQDKYLVKCDYGQILRVINNLLNNAADAIKAKYSIGNLSEGKIIINIREDLRNDQLYIEIIDNGCGIKQTIIDRISEPYVTTKQHGTGLGLAIVKKIIEEHGGKFSISNIKDGAAAAFNLSFFEDQKT